MKFWVATKMKTINHWIPTVIFMFDLISSALGSTNITSKRNEQNKVWIIVLELQHHSLYLQFNSFYLILVFFCRFDFRCFRHWLRYTVSGSSFNDQCNRRSFNHIWLIKWPINLSQRLNKDRKKRTKKEKKTKPEQFLRSIRMVFVTSFVSFRFDSILFRSSSFSFYLFCFDASFSW